MELFSINVGKIYMPIYMVLFLENSTLNASIYKLDLTGI